METVHKSEVQLFHKNNDKIFDWTFDFFSFNMLSKSKVQIKGSAEWCFKMDNFRYEELCKKLTKNAFGYFEFPSHAGPVESE